MCFGASRELQLSAKLIKCSFSVKEAPFSKTKGCERGSICTTWQPAAQQTKSAAGPVCTTHCKGSVSREQTAWCSFQVHCASIWADLRANQTVSPCAVGFVSPRGPHGLLFKTDAWRSPFAPPAGLFFLLINGTGTLVKCNRSQAELSPECMQT